MTPFHLPIHLLRREFSLAFGAFRPKGRVGECSRTKGAIENHMPGAEVLLTVVREGRETDVPLRLGISRE